MTTLIFHSDYAETFDDSFLIEETPRYYKVWKIDKLGRKVVFKRIVKRLVKEVRE